MKTQKRRKAVKDYLKHLKSSDLLQAVHRARHKATERLYQSWAKEGRAMRTRLQLMDVNSGKSV
jgi:hypothetical protein